ncbi:MAG TPA: polymer-forming cytoskeletal protein [Candidatus Limnocylindria bacterium]|nr:polymer-forming cytoskeletal protein [Candidatus Limnocylindria bacterium]
MPAKPQDKTLVVCPQCGHEQSEPRAAISSNCRQCGTYLHVQQLLHPTRKAEAKAPEQKRVACFDCGTETDVVEAAKSAMCKRCSSYIDLQDYTINSAVSKNFKTKGRFVVEGKGYLFNTNVVAREIVVKGHVIGKLAAEELLTIYSTAEIKGAFRAPLIVIPAGNVFHAREPLGVSCVDIAGELVSDVHAKRTVTLRSTGRLFGNVQARNLVVESGGVLVGTVEVRPAFQGEV